VTPDTVTRGRHMRPATVGCDIHARARVQFSQLASRSLLLGTIPASTKSIPGLPITSFSAKNLRQFRGVIVEHFRIDLTRGAKLRLLRELWPRKCRRHLIAHYQLLTIFRMRPIPNFT
jgi:hypothetical protein